MNPPKTDSRHTPIGDPKQIRALRSTVRQDIVDTLQALGSASVAELATHLDRAADTLYYHVRALLAAGLLVQLPEPRQRGRHRELVYALPEPDKSLKLVYRAEDGTRPESLSELVGSMLRASQREFDAAIADPDCVVDGPARELWAGRVKGWLSPEELIRCNVLLAEVAELLSALKTPERNRLYSLQFLLAPARRVAAPEAWPYPIDGDPEAEPATPATRSSAP